MVSARNGPAALVISFWFRYLNVIPTRVDGDEAVVASANGESR
jgi:hypothetical protein